jgi:FkbM family methyltransferase
MDIGANFGSFSLRMSELVGDAGRVFAFEPVPQTFALLATALSARGCRNVCALNLACSDTNGVVTMSIPDDPISGENLYQASISASGPALTKVVCARVDDLPLPTNGLRLVKIDAEGHDAEVISGMWQLIRRELPILVAEHPSEAIIGRLASLGYSHSHERGSPNAVFTPPRETS